MILGTLVKDVLLLRDKGALASMFLLPLAFITVFGILFKGAGDDDEKGPQGAVRIALFAPDGNAASETVRAAVLGSSALEVVRVQSEAEVDSAVAKQDVLAGLVIPADLAPKEGRPLLFYVDRARSAAEIGLAEGAVKSRAIAAYFESLFPKGAMESFGVPKTEDVLADREPTGVRRKRPKIDSFQITVPGNAVLFAFFIAIPIALSIVEERRLGTWKRLMATPADRKVMLLAKMIPFFVVGLLQMVFLFLVGALVFGMRVGGSWPALVLVSAATIFSAVALGFLVASFGGSEKQVSALASIAILVLGLLSGCMFPRAFFPDGLRSIGLFIPHGWALDAYQTVLVRDGAAIADVGLPCLVITGMGALYAGIGSLLFRFEK